jgi:uroporphyrinogen III methyltransferase/synthase
MMTSKVYLVGAGPGDPGLITVKGLNLIRRADCIIYDGLADPALLNAAKPEAEKISVAKRSGSHSMNQSQINALIVEKAGQHKIIVRLKGGDPCLFGRAAEEVAACIEAGIAFEIVPGVTSGVAAAAYAGIFLTHRDYASAVCFVTGRQAEGKDHSDVDWGHLASFSGTLVIYMGMENIDAITQSLLKNGKPGYTPAAVIYKAATPKQRVAKASLEHIARLCAEQRIEAPSIIIVGPVAEGLKNADWFMRNPLFGKRVLITRDIAGNRIFADKLASAGAEAVICDAIEIIDCTQQPMTQKALANLSAYDWVVFTSANGVAHTFDRLYKNGKDARALAEVKIACIGQPTADKLTDYGLKADFVPASFTSEAMSTEMIAAFDLRDRRMLLLRSQIAPKDIVKAFTDAGAQVTDVAVYSVIAREHDAEFISQITRQIENGQIDYITFTSASTACAFVNSVPQGLLGSGRSKIVSIGPAATKSLESMGLPPAIEARVHTIDGIIEVLKEQR